MQTNVQTAEQWQQVIENLDTMKKASLTQLIEVRAGLADLQSQRNIQVQYLSNAQQSEDTALAAIIQDKINKLNNRITGTQVVIGNIVRDIEEYDTDLNNAFKQKGLAEAGPPEALSTTQPASAQPGNPEAVSLPTQEIPVTKQFADADQPVATQEEFAYTPLETPPGTDEYDGLQTQIENNENGLQEPPNVDPEEDPFEASRRAAEDAANNTPPATEQGVINAAGGMQALQRELANTRAQATNQDQVNFTAQEDWRVRLSLSPTANYLYKAADPGVLKPLADTNGVIFPYTPSISVSYAANYDPTDLVHSNYKVYQYKNSSVDNIQISCDFTAQDTNEANYLLAVIHFFRSVTKMFYGQDNGPKPGTPPPLCFLTGLGAFQFNEHPLAITSFNYNLPTDVDYIRAGQITSQAGVNQQSGIRPMNSYDISDIRLRNIKPGGSPADTVWGSVNPLNATVTYVPTKMQIQIGAVPMISRNDASNNFSLTDYASGKLLRGIQNVRGGFW